jgi:hypothetical protein
VKLYGQERNLMTSSIARMNCFLHGIEDFRIERGDTLAEPKLVEGDRLQRFDVVLANPPYSIKQWNREAFAADPWGRNVFGVPPQGRADYAFQQHILQSLKPKTGRCAVLWPHGVLFRQEEADMRRKLIEADLIECVLGLGPNLFYNSPMEACVVICRTQKPKTRRGKILFINAVNEVTRERAQSFLKQMKEQVNPEADGVERYVGGEHMETENVHIPKWGTVGDGYLGPAFIRGFRKGQVLYGSRRTYLKKVAVAEWDGVTANTTFVIEAVEGKLLQELLPWLMLSERFTKHSVQESKGSTNPYINFPDIAKFEFDLPPLDQQRRIAEILWAVDEARQAWLEVGADTVRSRDVLLADLSNKSHPKVACGEILALASGKAKPKGLRQVAEPGADIPVYGGNGVIGYTEAPLLRFQTLSIGRVGEYCGCVHFVKGASWITDNSIYVKEHSKKVELRFLYWVLRAANLNKKKKIAGQPLISQSTITEESIPLPSISEQRRLLGQLDQVTNAAESSAEHAIRSGKLVSAILDTLLAP